MKKDFKNVNIYDVFHDECKEDGFWHCFVFISRETQKKLFNLLQIPRKNLQYYEFIHFVDIGRKYKNNNPKARLIRSWCSILLYSIQQQKIEAQLYLGHKNNKPIYELMKNGEDRIANKLIIFRVKNARQDMYDSMNEIKKIETTFRMGIKGGTHFLFPDKKISIGNVYIDSSKKAFEENFNSNNILERFKIESNKNIFFEDDSKIIPINKKDYKKNETISEFMQLTDILVGGIRTQKLRMIDFPARYEATFQFKNLLEKETENFARMAKSRYSKGFALSDAFIKNNKWEFKNMHIYFNEGNQQKLPMFYPPFNGKTI